MRAVAFEILCVWCVVGVPFAAHAGFAWWAAQTLLGFTSAWVDASEKNFEVLRRNGFSARRVWLTAALNVVATNALVAAAHLLAPPKTWEALSPHVAVSTLARVAASLAVTEVLFTLSHALLHRTAWGAKIHLMHHCCRDANWHVNLVFHPLDMAAEFSGPVLAVLALNWSHPRALALSVTAVHLWYALDHSALLKLPHTRHHARIDAVYSVYVHWLFPFRGVDRVRATLARNPPPLVVEQ